MSSKPTARSRASEPTAHKRKTCDVSCETKEEVDDTTGDIQAKEEVVAPKKKAKRIADTGGSQVGKYRYIFIPVGDSKATIADVLTSSGSGVSGTAFYYQVGSKKEDISATKLLVVLRKDGSIEDDAATIRKELKLGTGKISVSAAMVEKVAAGAKLFVQSTSSNRGLLPGTTLCIQTLNESVDEEDDEAEDEEADEDEGEGDGDGDDESPDYSDLWTGLTLPVPIVGGIDTFLPLPLKAEPKKGQENEEEKVIDDSGMDEYERKQKLQEENESNGTWEKPNTIVFRPVCPELIKAAEGILAHGTVDPMSLFPTSRYSSDKRPLDARILGACTDHSRAHMLAYTHCEEHLVASKSVNPHDFIKAHIVQIGAQKRGWAMVRAMLRDTKIGGLKLDAEHVTMLAAIDSSNAAHGSSDVASLIAGLAEHEDTASYASKWKFVLGGEPMEGQEEEEDKEEDEEEGEEELVAGASSAQRESSQAASLICPRKIRVAKRPPNAIRSKFGGEGYTRRDIPTPLCSQPADLTVASDQLDHTGCYEEKASHQRRLGMQLRLSDMPAPMAFAHALPGIPINRQLFQLWVCDASSQHGHIGRIVDMQSDWNSTSVVRFDSSSSSVKPAEPLIERPFVRWVEDRNSIPANDEFEALAQSLGPTPRRRVKEEETKAEAELSPLFKFERAVKRSQIKWYGCGADNRDDFGEGDFLSGFPLWDNGETYHECAFCHRRMTAMMQFFGNVWDAQFGEGTVGHIHQCPTHRQHFAWSWDCD